MKKVLLVVIALVMVLSGVAMVSAYEAHIVNVKAHVENAMRLSGVGSGPDYEYEFGTVFPEEWKLKKFNVTTSDSFCGLDQRRVLNFDYEIWVELKPKPDTEPVEYYSWLGDAMYFCVNWDYTAYPDGPEAGDMTWVGNTMPTPSSPAIYVMGDSINKDTNIQDEITMAVDVPVFEDYWNEHTDVDPKPSGLSKPTVVILKTDSRYPADVSTGLDLGVDVKIQITSIY